MTVKKFEELEIWKESRILVNKVYTEFNDLKNYAFKDQIYRASLSIMNNIAEGFDRSSDKEFIKFLFYSYSSCSEVRSMLYIAQDMNYLTKDTTNELMKLSIKLSKQISSLISYLKK